MRNLRRTTVAFALLAAGGAQAQDTVEGGADTLELSTLTVEADGASELFGQTFAESAGSVMKTDTPIVDTPRSVSVVTQQQMQDRGARTVTQALQYTPGVLAGGYGLDNRGDWALVRGFNPAAYLDGMQAQFSYYNNTKPETFLLDSIAVLKGPAGMLYGNGAVGGIVNATSKLPDPLAPNLVQLEVGSNNLFQSNLDVGGDLGADGTLRYRLVALGRDADGQIDYTSDDAMAIMPSLTWSPTDATSVTVLGLYQKTETSPMIQFLSPYGTLWSAEEFANGDFLSPSDFIGEPSFDEYNAERRSVSLFADHRFSSVWAVAGSLRYIESTVDYKQAWWAYDNFETGRYNPDGTINRTPQAAENDSHSWTGDLHATADFRLGETTHAVMAGASFTDGRFNYDWGQGETGGPIDPFNPRYTGMLGPVEIVDYPEMKVQQQSIYAQDRIVFRDKLTLDVGLRYDWIQSDLQTWDPTNPTQPADDGQLSTSVALLYAFDNGIVPYVSYSESFFQELTGRSRSGATFDPTRGTQYEAGVKYQPPGTTSLFTASVFEITKTNSLQPDPTDPNFSVQTGEAKARGLELGAQATWRDVSIDAGYAYLDTESEDGTPFAGVPRNQASAWLRYDASGRFAGVMAGFGVRYVGETVSGGVATPEFTLFDAMLGYGWDRYQVQLTGRNLADKTYVTNCSASDCFFGETRTIGLTLTASF